MDFDQYQQQAGLSAIYPRDGINGVLYTSLGLVNEAGEVGGKVKKMMRDDACIMTDDRKSQIASEIGDVLWYCAMLAHELGIDLSSIAEANIAKLAERMERNVISGDGDNR